MVTVLSSKCAFWFLESGRAGENWTACFYGDKEEKFAFVFK